MKKTFLFIILSATFIIARSQSNDVAIIKPNEHSIVKDSTGTVYPYTTWNKMVQTGEYRLKILKAQGDSSVLLISKMSEVEMDERFSKMSVPPPSPNFTTGEVPSSFSTNDIDGYKLKLKNLKGKVVVLNFWTTMSHASRVETPQLNALALKYAKDPNVIFIAITPEDEQAVRQFVKAIPFGYHLVADGAPYWDLYKIRGFPVNVVLDKEGKVIFHTATQTLNTPYLIKKTIEQAKQKSL